jgi:hypothetical protein
VSCGVLLPSRWRIQIPAKIFHYSNDCLGVGKTRVCEIFANEAVLSGAFRGVDLGFDEDMNLPEEVREREAVPICHRFEPLSWSLAGRSAVTGETLKKRHIVASPFNSKRVSDVRISLQASKVIAPSVVVRPKTSSPTQSSKNGPRCPEISCS